jgi:hypothetical protein
VASFLEVSRHVPGVPEDETVTTAGSEPIFAIGTPRIHRNASHSTVKFGSTTVRQQLNYGVEGMQSWTTLKPYIQEETKKILSLSN